MAVLNMILAGLTALIATFLSLSPTDLHGLAPWFITLSTRPVERAPSVSRKAVMIPDYWDQDTTRNLTYLDTFATDISRPDFSPPPPLPNVFSALSAEEDVEDEEPEEQHTEEQLRELWQLFRQALLRLCAGLNDFVMEHPYLQSAKVDCLGRCNLRRICIRNRLHRHRRLCRQIRFRHHGCLSSPVLPSPPALASSSSAPPTLTTELSQPGSSSSSAKRSDRLPIVEHLRQDTEGQEIDWIVELEKELKVLKEGIREVKSELVELRRSRP